MATLAYHAPSRALTFRLGREVVIVFTVVALFLGGLVLGIALHGSHAARTQSLVPTQTETAP
jgi:hypothetical protein